MYYPIAIEVDDNQHAYGVIAPDLLIRRIDNAVEHNSDYKRRSAFLARAAMHELEHHTH